MLTQTTEKAQSRPAETCPQCNTRPSTKFVRIPDYGFGGNPAYGSFSAPRCTECAETLKSHPTFAGMRIDITEIRT